MPEAAEQPAASRRDRGLIVCYAGMAVLLALAAAFTVAWTALPAEWFDRSVAERAERAIGRIATPESPESIAARQALELTLDISTSDPPRYQGLPKK